MLVSVLLPKCAFIFALRQLLKVCDGERAIATTRSRVTSRKQHEYFRTIHSSAGWNIPAGGRRVVARCCCLLFFAGRAVAESRLPNHFGRCAGARGRSSDGSFIACR